MAVIRLKKPVADASPVDRAEAFFAWLADTFVFAAGPKRGQPLILEPFQQDYVRMVLERDGPDPAYRMAIFSTPRKNGKTLVLATLLLGFMLPDSPVSIPGCRAGITAPTGRHALFIFQAAVELLDAAGRKGEAKILQYPSPGYFTTKGGARCDIYSGSKTSGHGASLSVALVDEAGLLKRNSVLIDNFTDALAIENGQLLVTGTLGESREYADLIDNPPPRTAVVFYGMQRGDDPASPEVWRRCNPGLGAIKSERFMADQFAKAEAAGTLRDFEAWNLNARLTPAKELLLDFADYEKAIDPEAGPLPEEPVHLGLDLGGSSAQTAACIVHQSGFIRHLSAFPSEPMDLHQRGQRDGCGDAYARAEQAGDLITTAGSVTDLPQFLSALVAKIGPHPVASVSCDRYRREELLTALARAGIAWKPRFRGNGPKDGDADIRATRKLFLSGSVKLHPSDLMTLALAETDVRVSYTGACQLDKASRFSRIDLAQALVLGCSALLEDRDRVPVTYEIEAW